MSGITDAIRENYNERGADWRNKVWVGDEELDDQIKTFMNLPKVPLMLDVGCGAGDYGVLFDADVKLGADISRSMLEVCRSMDRGYILVEANGATLPFLDNTFDQVVSRNFLQNFEDSADGLKEMLRVLKPGGVIAIMEGAVSRGEEEFPARSVRVVEPYHPDFPSHEGLNELLQSVGIVDIEQQPAGIERKWLAAWAKSKGATPDQQQEMYDIHTKLPHDYLKAYNFQFFPEETEISSRISFSMLKGRKAT